MKCDVCSRRDATAVITMIMAGKNTVRRVCPQCVRKLQRGDAYAAQMALLGTMSAPAEEIKCPVCGCTSEQLRRSGHVGCANCYQAFAPLLQPLSVRMNGALQHAEGESPAAPADERAMRLNKLREAMFAAVNAEEYERAAQLRDEIRAMEQTDGEAQG